MPTTPTPTTTPNTNPGFFDNPQSTYSPNPEPAGFDLLRDMLMRKSFALGADPYGGNQMRPNSLQPAPAFAGSGSPINSSFFYGQPGEDGSGGGTQPPAPRSMPSLIDLMRRQPMMVPPRGSMGGGGGMGQMQGAQGAAPEPGPSGNPLQALLAMLRQKRGSRFDGKPGGLFRDMAAAKQPAINARDGMTLLMNHMMSAQGQPQAQDNSLASKQMPAASDSNARPMYDGSCYDGGIPTADLPGFDGNPNAINWGPMQRTGLRTWGAATPWTGQWQMGANGMPLGPGGMQFTGAQHEFSGGVGVPQVQKINAAQAQGGPTYAQWIDKVRELQTQKHLADTAASQQRSQANGTAGINFLDPKSWGSHPRMANPTGSVPGTVPQTPMKSATLPAPQGVPQPRPTQQVTR